MRKLVCCPVLLFCLVPTPVAFSQGVQLFGGYSYLRTSGMDYEHAGLSGWNAAVSVTLGSWGVVADFSNHYGASTNNFTPIGNGGRGTAFLFGPQYSFRHIPRVTPFVHALFGGVEGAQAGVMGAALGAGGSCPAPACSGITYYPETAFALALGGGLDIKIRNHLWIRPIQADYIRQNFSDGAMNSPRISAGIVFRFGK
jgi:hypothetical protein